MSKNFFAATIAAMCCTASAFAASKFEPVNVQLTVRADTPGAKIDANIYGQFMEHLGRNVYEGIWVGPDSHPQHARLSQ